MQENIKVGCVSQAVFSAIATIFYQQSGEMPRGITQAKQDYQISG